RRPSTLRNGQNEETEVAKPTLKPDIFKWLEGGHLNPGMTELRFSDGALKLVVRPMSHHVQPG
ncbi:hypothetical protein, partial [Burkholderia ambifaria]|uniref:hypothetical protein n=1 Tax=Burkholderia ambifaria TaxID=152480 RepID=UPI001ABB4DC5